MALSNTTPSHPDFGQFLFETESNIIVYTPKSWSNSCDNFAASISSSHISKKKNWSTKYCECSSAKQTLPCPKRNIKRFIPSQLAFAPQHGGASFARTGPNASQAPVQAKHQCLHGHAFLTPLPAVRLGCPASSMIRRETTKTGLCNTVLPQMFQTILYDSSNGNRSSSLPTNMYRSAKTLAWASPPWTRDTRGVRTQDMSLWRWTQCNSRSRSSSSAPCRHAVV